MKKALIIALCCITVLFAACNKQKPNEKFVGDWEGSGLVNGTINFGFATQELKDIALPMNIHIAAGEAKNEVIMTYTNEEVEEVYRAKGIVDDYDVDFEPIAIDQLIEGTTVHATLDLEGTLLESEGILALKGTLTGNGNLADGGQSLSFTITDGTVIANLNKATSPIPGTDPVDPKLTLKTGESYLAEGDEIISGCPIKVGLTCEADKLAKLVVTFKMGETVVKESTKTWENGTTDNYEEIFVINEAGDITMTAVLTDTHNKTASVSVNFKIIAAPDPQYEAHYQGTVTLDATASAIMFSYPINTDYDMDILMTEEGGRVNATIIFAGESLTTTGVKNGNTIDLDPFDIVLDIEGSSITATLNMTGDINGTIFKVEGTLDGSGNINLSGFNVPATIEGTVSGDLNEIE